MYYNKNHFLSIIAFLIFIHTSIFGSAFAQEITRTNVTFDNGRFTLHGELVIPDTSDNAPVIVFLVGSGANSSHRTLYEDFVQQNLEKLFLDEGVAILYFDKRGIGKSDGRWQRTNLYERASDAKAAIDFLKTQGRIDSSRIGIIGHGQGGWVAQIIGDRFRNDIKFIASLAAPTFDVKLQLTNDYYSRFLCEGEEDGKAFDKASKKALSDINWVTWFPVTKAWRQLKEISDFDPAPHLLELDIPSLFVFAENDYFVYPGWAIGALNDTFKQSIPENFNLQIIPGANHDFRLAEMCTSIEDSNLEPYSSYFQQIFKSWVLSNL
ncbi:MAG: alpha/beta fold hydrolase [Balneolaceae bacterium]